MVLVRKASCFEAHCLGSKSETLGADSLLRVFYVLAFDCVSLDNLLRESEKAVWQLEERSWQILAIYRLI